MDHAVSGSGAWAADHHIHRAGMEEKTDTDSARRRFAREWRGPRTLSYSGPEGHGIMTVAFLACAMVTLGTLFYIFYLPGRLHMGPDKTRLADLQERKDAVYENLRDLNFEHQAGKLPDQDYQSLKASLEEEAAGILAEMAGLEPAVASGLSINGRMGNGKGARG